MKTPEKRRAASARFRANNPGYQKAWRAKNREKANEGQRERYRKNREYRRKYAAKWTAKQSERREQGYTEWFADPSNHRYIWAVVIIRFLKDRQRRKNRANSPEGKVRAAAYASIKRMVKAGVNKKTRTSNYIGCDASTLRAHIESQFKDGMTWCNYGKKGWHIDHRIPLAAIGAVSEKTVLHYTNLQPMWALENTLKGDSFDPLSVAA